MYSDVTELSGTWSLLTRENIQANIKLKKDANCVQTQSIYSMKIFFSKTISKIKRKWHRKGWEELRKDVKTENCGQHTLLRLTKLVAMCISFS